MPLKSSLISFALLDDGVGTIARVSPDYEIRFGPVGRLIDRVVARRQYERGMRHMLAGLKHHVETGDEVGDRPPPDAG